jgi:membrane protein
LSQAQHRVAERPFYVSLGWTVRDYAKRVWDNSGEDNVLFLAGGVAFNIILAAVPFILLAAWSASYLFKVFDPSLQSTSAVQEAIDRLLPTHQESPDSPYHSMLTDLFKANASLGIFSAVGFVWFSTRLFGSLRTVLASIFDIEYERGIIEGKIFDVKITVVASLLFVLSMAVSAYITIATSRGVVLLEQRGLRKDVMHGVEYWTGRTIAFAILLLMFFALYKFLPVRRVRTATAWFAAAFTGVMFELARVAFAYYMATFNPGSLYTRTLAAIVVIVVWFYYAALIFILGGEVGQVYELRRTRKLQREVFN